MEAFNFESGKIKGIEVLFFEEAEVQKMRGNKPIFAAMGPLSVLYFKDYHRFVLQLNDWRYPLLRRLNISGSDKNFTLPGMNGATFNLRILGNPSQDTLKNLETIMMNNSSFGGKALETSPDDKLMRHKPKDTTLMDKVTETAKQIVEKIHAKTETIKTGTKHITSTKKRTLLKDINNKDFKKNAHSTFKKDFFEAHHKITNNFLSKRKENPNLTHAADFSELLKTNDTKAPVHFIHKEGIEEAILNNKEAIMMK
jgi:hypothetical protein